HSTTGVVDVPKNTPQELSAVMRQSKQHVDTSFAHQPSPTSKQTSIKEIPKSLRNLTFPYVLPPFRTWMKIRSDAKKNNGQKQEKLTHTQLQHDLADHWRKHFFADEARELEQMALKKLVWEQTNGRPWLITEKEEKQLLKRIQIASYKSNAAAVLAAASGGRGTTAVLSKNKLQDKKSAKVGKALGLLDNKNKDRAAGGEREDAKR
ncbi:unnamed protein product, partial [Amoebophrya sp. A120]